MITLQLISGPQTTGHTYQSHVIGCRAALEILNIFKQDDLVSRCNHSGLRLEELLRERVLPHPNVGDVR